MRFLVFLCTFVSVVLFMPPCVRAAALTVDLGDAQQVTLVGAIQRWDIDGNHRRPVDPKAAIDAPYVDARAVHKGGGKWVFENLPKGTYDLLIMAQPRVRVEGFQYVPVLEFDPFIKPDQKVDDEVRDFIVDDIRKARHYENIVRPLYMAGNDRNIRVLVMLIRDQPTSYTPGAGTMRFEIWQYDNNYGGWQKHRRTKVLHRVLMQVSELRQWTWLWDTRLGGIEIADQPVTIEYRLPQQSDKTLGGLYPY
ncbi:MAG: hypothetical protein RBS80_11395 [Thermoguttaceae bacterium]|nr:hypothetical protein [Thermoguttaceae bacterium]